MCRLTSITFLLLICLLTSCKKSSSTGNVEFSFNYNGRTYDNVADGAPIVSNGDIIGIEIRKPDVFGGVLRFFWNNNCAYIIPSGTDIFYDDNTCKFNSARPIDSSRLYIYHSGGKQNYTISNCQQKDDAFTGAIYETCTVSGSFALVLINNAGNTKSIMGTFKLFNLIR
jgi:hypothetical protein